MSKPFAGAHVVLHRLLMNQSRQGVQVVLLSKRTLDAPTHPGHWGLFGGEIEDDELPAAAVKREVEEELGVAGEWKLDLAKLKDLTEGDAPRADGIHKVKYYSYQFAFDLDHLALRRNANGKVEGDGIAWFTKEEVENLKIRPEDRSAIGQFFQKHT